MGVGDAGGEELIGGEQGVRYIINNYPSSQMERQYVARYLSQIPREKTMGWVGSVKAIRTLRENDDPTFQTPLSRVNNLSRNLYRQVRDALNNQRHDQCTRSAKQHPRRGTTSTKWTSSPLPLSTRREGTRCYQDDRERRVVFSGDSR